MAQETETAVEATEEVTTPEDLGQPEGNLAPESLGQETPEQPGNEQKPTEAPSFNPDEEHVIEFGGKTYTVKGKELQSVLENHAALTEREKALNRDYTQKTQALAKERKSFEAAFGRMPETQEIQALGKLYQSYLADPNVAKVVDAILSGQPLESVLGEASTQVKGNANPEVAALQREIHSLKGQLSQFLSSSEQKEAEAAMTEGKRIFDTWRESKKTSGTTVPEELVDHILETANSLRRRNPSWDANKALDEALRRETIDQIQTATTKQVLTKADNAKKTSSVKITPKSTQKPDSASGYSDIFKSAM